MPMRYGRAQAIYLPTTPCRLHTALSRDRRIRLRLELFEQSTQLERRTRPTMRHQRVREVSLTIERPADDRWPCQSTFSTRAFRPGWPLRSARTGRLGSLDSAREIGRLAARQKDQCGDLAAKFGKFTLERRKRLLGFTAM
jgi:hypothetical protein